MDSLIIQFIWWVQSLPPLYPMLAGAVLLLLWLLWQLIGRPLMGRVHKDTWL
jgi:hypothetical protein